MKAVFNMKSGKIITTKKYDCFNRILANAFDSIGSKSFEVECDFFAEADDYKIPSTPRTRVINGKEVESAYLTGTEKCKSQNNKKSYKIDERLKRFM